MLGRSAVRVDWSQERLPPRRVGDRNQNVRHVDHVQCSGVGSLTEVPASDFLLHCGGNGRSHDGSDVIDASTAGRSGQE
jgi:hypothetical protein